MKPNGGNLAELSALIARPHSAVYQYFVRSQQFYDCFMPLSPDVVSYNLGSAVWKRATDSLVNATRLCSGKALSRSCNAMLLFSMA